MARLNEDRATRYHRSRLRAAAGGQAAALLVVGVAALTAAGPALARWVERVAAGTAAAWLAQTLLFTGLLFVVARLARFPFDAFADWALERRYGLDRTRFARWLGRHLRGVLVQAALVGGIAIVVRVSLTLWPAAGWLAAAIALGAGHLAWSLALPRLLARVGVLRPLDDRALADRVRGLGRRLGVTLDVLQWHGGGAKHAHAILARPGRTPCVILSDTLIDTLSEDEIEIVVAHEVAHQVHGDMWTTAVWRLFVLCAAFATASLMLGRLAGPGVAAGDLVALAPLGLVALLVAGAAAPVGLAISRRLERRADAFALAHTGRPDAFVSSMRRLAAHNLVDERPTRVARLFASHPSVAERVLAAHRRAG